MTRRLSRRDDLIAAAKPTLSTRRSGGLGTGLTKRRNPGRAQRPGLSPVRGGEGSPSRNGRHLRGRGASLNSPRGTERAIHKY